MTPTLLTLAVVLTGLSAGLFATFSYAVMPGLGRGDDDTFVRAMRGINEAILNPVFAVVFVGAPVAAAAALMSGWSGAGRTWMIAGLLLYVLGAFVVTATVNVPRNDALATGTEGDAVLRERFESGWVRSNHARSLLTTAAFVCLVRAAVVL